MSAPVDLFQHVRPNRIQLAKDFYYSLNKMVYQLEDASSNQRINQEVGSVKKLKWDAEPVDASTQKLIDEVVAQGYVIIKNAFTNTQADEALEELARLSAGSDAGPAAAGGRNPFEGYQTQRIYNLVNKSRVFDKFILHPSVVALNNYFMDPGWLLSVCHSISIQPGEDPQTLHHDDGHVTVPRPHRPFGTASTL